MTKTAQHRGDKGADHPTRGPAKRLTPEEFEAGCIEYFEDCESRGKKVTVSGLAYALGFSSHQSVHDYKKDPDYKFYVDRAYLYIEKMTEEGLVEGEIPPAAGIFTLKARFGLVDKQEVNHVSSDGSMSPKGKSLDDFYAESSD